MIRLIITVNGRNLQRISAPETELLNLEDRGWLFRLSLPVVLRRFLVFVLRSERNIKLKMLMHIWLFASRLDTSSSDWFNLTSKTKKILTSGKGQYSCFTTVFYYSNHVPRLWVWVAGWKVVRLEMIRNAGKQNQGREVTETCSLKAIADRQRLPVQILEEKWISKLLAQRL